jgi:hypothetical protein
MSQYPVERTVKWGPLVFGLLLLTLGVAFARDAWSSHNQAPESPIPVTADQIAAAKTPNGLPGTWVTFSPDEIVYTGVSRVEGTRYKIRYYYNLVRVGSNWAVLSSREATPKGALVVTAKYFNSDQDRSAVAELYSHKPKASWLPFHFDRDVSPQKAPKAIGIMAVILLALGGLLSVASLNLRRSADPMQESSSMDLRPEQRW